MPPLRTKMTVAMWNWRFSKKGTAGVLMMSVAVSWLLTLSSCEKAVMDDSDVTETTAKGNVVIRVTNVEAGWASSDTRALVNVAEVCSRLCFAVYQDGNRKSYKNQAVADSDFGTFSLQLEEGIYQILVLAHSGNANPATTNPAKLQFTNPDSSKGTGFTDTFFYYGDLIVGDEGTQLDISMKRATAMFRLVTTDVKPAAVKKFQFYYEGGSGALDATTGLGCIDSKQSVFVTTGDELTGKTLQFDMFTFLHAEEDEVTFTVKAFSANESILYEKEFSGVSMQRNCITRYTGDFFTNGDVIEPDPDEPDTPQPDKPSAVTVMVDPEWGGVFDFTF